ncbi:MAG: transcriptional repressor LexA [Ignavibacteria bacterium]|nr:transcriptional repressor LexA [Ignavibacteria bacterium]
MKKELTDRQQEILSFIEQFRDENGYPPTLRQIGKQFGISSTFGVKRHMDALVKKGHILVESNASRGITVLSNFESISMPQTLGDIEKYFKRIPIIGRVAAGVPITAVENHDGDVVVDPAMVKGFDTCFALKVKGDSMVNAGIMEKDHVIVAAQNFAKHDDIVVALIDDEATVKRYWQKNNQIKLMPENDNYQPIEIVNKEVFHIAGKVIGVIRWYN